MIVIYTVAQLLYSAFFLLKTASLLLNQHVGNFTLGKGEEYNMFVAGDSIGAGLGATKFETSVVGRVAGEIAKKRTVKLTNKSVSGYRMVDIFKVAPPQKKQDLILLIIGSNDLFHFTGIESFKRNTRKILELYAPLANKLIIVGPGRIFDAGAIPLVLKPIYKVRAPLYANVMNQEAGKFKNVVYVNPIEANFHDNYGPTGSVDHFHPNDEGHRFWFDLIKPSL